jgi:hypothetical protein
MKCIRGQKFTVDCIKMKRRIQEEITSETAGMTPAQRLAYYKKLAEGSPFAEALRNRKQTQPAA